MSTVNYSGKVVSAASNSLVVSSHDGRQHSHTMFVDANVSYDGTTCKVEDLKAGMKIRVTTKEDIYGVATRLEAINKDEEFGKRVRPFGPKEPPATVAVTADAQ